jgi:hypothetical protein
MVKLDQVYIDQKYIMLKKKSISNAYIFDDGNITFLIFEQIKVIDI